MVTEHGESDRYLYFITSSPEGGENPCRRHWQHSQRCQASSTKCLRVLGRRFDRNTLSVPPARRVVLGWDRKAKRGRWDARSKSASSTATGIPANPLSGTVLQAIDRTVHPSSVYLPLWLRQDLLANATCRIVRPRHLLKSDVENHKLTHPRRGCNETRRGRQHADHVTTQNNGLFPVAVELAQNRVKALFVAPSSSDSPRTRISSRPFSQVDVLLSQVLPSSCAAVSRRLGE